MNTLVSPANAPFSFALDWLCGVSPVEADGTADGHAWYFRGKGNRWEFVVSLTARAAPVDLATRFDAARGFRLHGCEDDVGARPENRIRALIAWAARQFHAAETSGEMVVCCAACPDATRMTEHLARLGFGRVVTLPALTADGIIPGVPAQHHYRDSADTEAIFLAGRDRLETNLPAHAARFWVTRGSDAGAYRRVISLVTRKSPVVAPRFLS